VQADCSARGATNAQVLLNFSLSHDPNTDRWHVRSVPSAGQGAASARVFLDYSGNGRFDPGEPGVEGVRLTAGGRAAVRTDSLGLAFMQDLPTDQWVDVSLDARSLGDPLWVPRSPGLRVVAQPGQPIRLDFPVLVTGEAMGTVFFRAAVEPTPAANVGLEFVDVTSGDVKWRGQTAFDGFYDAVGIMPGRYVIRVAPSEATRLGVSTSPERTIEIARDGTILDGIDLVLERE
jgi:hypothetical protein